MLRSASRPTAAAASSSVHSLLTRRCGVASSGFRSGAARRVTTKAAAAAVASVVRQQRISTSTADAVSVTHLQRRSASPFTFAAAPFSSSAAAASASSVGGKYSALHQASLAEPNEFWLRHAECVDWRAKGSKALSKVGSSAEEYRWYADGWKINACENMVDRHVARGLGDRVAIIHDSPQTKSITKITYAQLLDRVSRLAGALRKAGVKKGDRVLVYMPMIPETIEAMLAISRLGAIHSVVFGGFPSAELAKRIRDAEPSVILTASCGLEGASKVVPYKDALDKAIELSGHNPKKVLVFQRPQVTAPLTEGRDEDWAEFVATHGSHTDPEVMDATDPLYILYTSGTTGAPKGVVRDHASLVALRKSMDWVYAHDESGVFWSASDLGWAVGHSYIVYAPLLEGTTTVLYEGKPVGTPDAGAFWRVVEQHKVNVLFTAPTALRAIRREDEKGDLRKKYDLSTLKGLYLAGERADPASVSWAEGLLNVPVVDHYWQTETGWAIVANPRGVELLPFKAGSATVPMPGWDVRVVDDEGHEVDRGVQGNLVCKLPLPPSGLHELWRNPERFRKSYMTRFPGFYDTSDAGMIDQDGYVSVMTRTDDVMNVAGHRLSSGQMEEVLQENSAVAESAVIAVPDELRGHVPIGLVVLKSGGKHISEEQLEKDIVAAVRSRVGAVACFKRVIVVQRLPKTRSGKVIRACLRAIAEGAAKIPVPPTIEDESVIPEITAVLNKHGFGAKSK